MGIGISGSWVQSIMRALLQPDSNELLELSRDISPAIVLEIERREWANLKNEFHYAGSISQIGVAAQLSAVGIRVPASVDEVAVVYFFHNTSVVNADLILGNLGQLLAVPGTVAEQPALAILDSRNANLTAAGTPSISSAALTWRAASVGGISQGFYQLHDSLAAGERLTKEQHGYLAVLGPGGYLGLQTQALLTAISANWWFYERPTRRGRIFI